jgi:hypothetical protein
VPPTSSARAIIISALYDKDTNVLTYWSPTGLPSSSPVVHLHRGAPGTNGPIIAMLPSGSGFLPFEGRASIPEADEAALLSGGTYIDVHNAEFPDGEVRGGVVPL